MSSIEKIPWSSGLDRRWFLYTSWLRIFSRVVIKFLGFFPTLYLTKAKFFFKKEGSIGKSKFKSCIYFIYLSINHNLKIGSDFLHVTHFQIFSTILNFPPEVRRMSW